MYKVSIVIPTYNKLDLLKTCIDSIKRNTNLDDCEIIVVCNGCADGSKEYVQSLGHPFKLLYWGEPLGYTRATNMGISAASGEFVILLNNDCQILDWGKDTWLTQLLEPFENEKVAVTGPVISWRGYRPWAMFALAAIRRNIIAKIGLLDESFSPGGGEDTEFCLRAQDKGYLVVSVPQPVSAENIQYPIWHIGHMSMGQLQGVSELYKRNDKILADRYGSKVS